MRQVFHALILVLVCSVANVCVAGAQALRTPQGMIEKSLSHGGLERAWLIYAPPGLEKNAPAVVLLHGGTQSMRKMFAPNAGGTQAWVDLANRNHFLLLVPNAVNPDDSDPTSDRQTWNVFGPEQERRRSTADDVGFILKMLDQAEENYSIDASQVYVTGASNGGMMTFRLLIEAPERFAAGAAFIASLPADMAAVPQPKVRRPLMLYNGTLDGLIKYGGGRIGAGLGETAPVPQTVDWWARALHANTANPIRDRLPNRDRLDRCVIERTRLTAGADGARLSIYLGVGGGHSMPSIAHKLPDTPFIRTVIGPQCHDAEGAALAWRFFTGED